MNEIPITVGDTFQFRKTVSESDVYLFAGITGDLSPNHVDEEAMAKTAYGGRIAHGALLVGYMSACSTMACEKARESAWGVPVSLGYDRVRFLSGVRIGETITIHYAYTNFNSERARSTSKVEVRVGDKLVAVADHIMTWVR
ncbi:MaoC/PaaZ C-terminal domain-containing protein [Paracoccus sp. SCSIO 75233]|uniref:MaoC/PaaZ C-terminal domain-containing protein n=1 Tax=Paracoccus sp. SCSIO 75233 TaxID=3017782 RepID=UPI0022F1191E|nr:MaoC/PaaZ C-terminal domain-containing protein [Paracoccus sp. SCSIO 75233]WBU53061.1 MaoC/PaaZ C-terminal domain-containing protein [Paracoccus sp. SCSIO 75233]